MEKRTGYNPFEPEKNWGYKLLHKDDNKFDNPIYDLDWGYKREVADKGLERREHCNDYPNCIKMCADCLYTTLYRRENLFDKNK